MSVPFPLERTSRVPLHRQIYEAFRTGILTGRFRPGERVPSSRALAASYDVARITVSAAYDQLLGEGYFETRHGSGTFISSELPDHLFHPVRAGVVSGNAARTIALSRYGSRLGQIQRLPASARPINLSNASPDPASFPLPLWRRLVSRHLRKPAALFEHAGQPAGDPRLRQALAAYLSRTRAVRCSPDQIIIVSGSQQALDLCARLLLDPEDEVAVEQPGYATARQLFLAHGATLRAMRVTDEGASVGDLTSRTRLVHVTPSHQFPTGVSMSLAARLALVDWTRTHSAVVLEDDYDSEYRYDGPPLPAMQSLGGGETGVIYIGTFSNVMFRGLRIGYVVVPGSLIEAFTTAKWITDRHTTLLEQAALADFLEEGHLDRHVRRMRRLYKSRRDTMIHELQRRFGSDVTIRGDAAGMHLTVTFRDPQRVRARAEATGVHLASTEIYYQSKAPRNEFMLGFSAIGERTVREGIKRIAGGR
jgi:GntR family transcriptional regulator / MocR family aminotransferase